MVTGLSWKSLLVILLALVVVLAAYLAKLPRQWLNTIDVLATELRYQVRGLEPPADELRVVGITEQTIAQFAASGVYYPFPRDWQGVAIRRLADAGARIVVLDILFSEADSWDEAEDAALSEAVAYAQAHGCAVVLAAAIERTDYTAGVHSESLVTPAPLIMAAAPTLGLSNTLEKLSFKLNEQASLSLPLGADGGEVEYYSQAVAAYSLYCAQTGRDFAAELERAVVRYTDPLTGSSKRVYRINYSSPPENSPGHLYDYQRLFPELWLANETDPAAADAAADGGPARSRALTAAETRDLAEVFDGTVVFIGSRSRADNDYFNTPLGQMYGVDTNAQAFDTLARGRLIHTVAPVGVCLIVAGLALLSWLLSSVRPILRSAIGGAIGAVLVAAINIGLFVFFRIELSLSTTELGWLLPCAAGIVYGAVSEEVARRRIRSIFERYVSDEIIDQLIADPELAGLGGVERRVAVLFNDIRSYSTITERMSPQQIVSFLNVYLTEATTIIRQNHGFVDKFLGDGLMAFFGGPVPTADPAGDALRAALQLIHALHETVHPRLRTLGAPCFKVGIGIHYGPAVMGNIGSEQRCDYTLIGDTVNVAARVESQTKEFGWAVVVTRDVLEAAGGDAFDSELVGKRLVKGREQPVEMYRIIDPSAPDMFRLVTVHLEPLPVVEPWVPPQRV